MDYVPVLYFVGFCAFIALGIAMLPVVIVKLTQPGLPLIKTLIEVPFVVLFFSLAALVFGKVMVFLTWPCVIVIAIIRYRQRVKLYAAAVPTKEKSAQDWDWFNA